ncbi:MAG: hypothetical protein V1742_07210 [Pseudomonadota bacterium]
MTVIIKIVLFVFGMCLCVQVMAALYGLIDLWYDRRRNWPKAARTIILWGGLGTLIALALGPAYRSSFLYGLGAEVVLYVGYFFWLNYLVKRPPRLFSDQ